MNKFILSLLIFISGANATEIKHPECQTDETRRLRAIADAEFKAGRHAGPDYICNGGTCPYDQAKALQQRFWAIARLDLYKAQALEALKCPQWAKDIEDE